MTNNEFKQSLCSCCGEQSLLISSDKCNDCHLVGSYTHYGVHETLSQTSRWHHLLLPGPHEAFPLLTLTPQHHPLGKHDSALTSSLSYCSVAQEKKTKRKKDIHTLQLPLKQKKQEPMAIRSPTGTGCSTVGLNNNEKNALCLLPLNSAM